MEDFLLQLVRGSSPEAVLLAAVAWFTIKRALNGTRAKIDATAARVAEIHRDTRQLLERVDAHLERIEERLDHHADRISRLEGRLFPFLPQEIREHED